MVLSLPSSDVQFALYEPCSKDDDTDDEADDNINTRMIRIFVYKGGCCSREDGVLKISFGTFGSTDSYINQFST